MAALPAANWTALPEKPSNHHLIMDRNQEIHPKKLYIKYQGV